MKKAILATKVGMTQIFNEDGVLTPVTVLQAGPCVVTQVKTMDNDGYEAVQVGFGDKRENLVNKPMKGHFDKAGVSCRRYVRELKLEGEYSLGQEIKADIFAAGDKIDATAISKGKGFQGAIKRHGQSRGPMAHGSKYHRHAGSNGACSDPSKVFKGKGMPGQMGHVKVTVQNLEIVRVDAENNLLLVKGAVPGPKKSLVTVKETVKAARDMEKAISTLNEVKESIINAYAFKTGLTHNRIAKLMENETWMNAKKAVELGFADEILFEAVEPEEDPDEEDPDEGEDGTDPEEEKEEGIHLTAQMYSSRQMGLTILNRLGVREEKPPSDTPKPPVEGKPPAEPEPPERPVLDLDGKTEDGSVPYNILLKQLECMK